MPILNNNNPLNELDNNTRIYPALAPYFNDNGLTEHRDKEGNSVLHQLTIIFGQLCNSFHPHDDLDDEIFNEDSLEEVAASFSVQVEILKDLMQYILKNTAQAHQLAHDPYVFNNTNSTAVHLLLTGYINTPFLYINGDDNNSTDIPLLKDLLTIYPKETIFHIYAEILCSASDAFVRRRYINIIRDVLLTGQMTFSRLEFHGKKNSAECIFPSDLDAIETASKDSDNAMMLDGPEFYSEKGLACTFSHGFDPIDQNSFSISAIEDSEDDDMDCNYARPILCRGESDKSVVPQYQKLRNTANIQMHSSPPPSLGGSLLNKMFMFK
jgi:hypothetical protein